MKHRPIPGPWVAEHSGTGDATVVAKPGWKNSDGSPYNPVIVERIDWPTACLIAAAPELLVALVDLEVAATAAQVVIVHNRPNGHIAFTLEGAIDQARAIIAKAKGEA